MIIDPKNREEKAEAQNQILRLMAGFERIGEKRFGSVLNKQYLESARYVDQGMMNVDYAVNKQAGLMTEAFIAFYLSIGRTFGELFSDALKTIERKATADDYRRTIHEWATTQAAQKVTKIQKTTKKLLARVINNGVSKGLSFTEIATSIRKQRIITNPTRAFLIARNESHTASVNAVQKAAESSRVEMEREWVAKIDGRTHGVDPKDKFNHISANGERVGMKEVFTRTGEALMYPGDPAGSPENTIQCRCVVVYHRAPKVNIQRNRTGG